MKLLITLIFCCLAGNRAMAAPKNFVIILTDDQGYEDLSCYGSNRVKTPNIDELAKEGMRFTSFYSASSVCSPSRAGLLTGRMPVRAGVPQVLFPHSDTGMPSSEITLAELLKEKGYSTGIVGKWHLGHAPEMLPLAQGFDSYFGLPYSNDMSIAKELPISPVVKLGEGYTKERVTADIAQYQKDYLSMKSIMPLMRGNEVIEYPVDQDQLTERYTEEAVKFIDQNRDKPFFLYLAHSMPHTPIHVSKKFTGSSGGDVFCDSIQEIDWSVGEIVKALKANGLYEDTFLLFTSDNGPARAGSAGELRGRKFTTFEGGQRVPAIIHAPGSVIAGKVCDEMVASLDIFPTIARYAEIELPIDRVFDGYDLTELLSGKIDKSPREEFYYYSANSEKIDGIRDGEWKYLEQGERAVKGKGKTKLAKKESSEMLFNLKSDVRESQNLLKANPEKTEQLASKMRAFDAELKADQ